MKEHTVPVVCLLAIACITPFIKSVAPASAHESQQTAGDPTGATRRVVVHAAGRGVPYITLEDGIELTGSYEGLSEMQSLLKQNAAEPRALASADFDEDGVPDLICGYARAGGGIITLYRGNVDSIFPNSPEAQKRKKEGMFTNSAFHLPARAFKVPAAADFIGAGDFDADTHWDVVAAARDGKALWLLPGDGKGGFLAARKIKLPGMVHSLITGEINRADGLTDIVVGVVAYDGPRALVFEGPEGALEASPEVFSLPAEPNALALGQLDGNYAMDLAVGAGSELVIIYGRDRKLSLDETKEAEVLPARVSRQSAGFQIMSVVVGDFTGENKTSLALLSPNGTVYLTDMKASISEKSKTKKRARVLQVLGQWRGAAQLVCARVSSGPADDLLLLNKERSELQILKTGFAGIGTSSLSSAVRVATSLDVEGEPLAVLPLRLNIDALSDLVILRAKHSAPALVNTTAAQTFIVNTEDDHDDTLCDSVDCTLREAIDAANANVGADTITFNIPGSGAHTINLTFMSANFPLVLPLQVIRDPLTIDGTTQPGFAGSPIIELNGISLQPPPFGGVTYGLRVEAGNSVVRGLVINRVNGNGMRIATTGNNIIEGNFVGTNVAGTAGLPNTAKGIDVASSANLIGGTTVQARNVVSGNVLEGIALLSSSNKIQGNFIGTDRGGTSAVPNRGAGGISLHSTNAMIGDAIAGARNVISGNLSSGIFISEPATGTLVQGNFIGTDVTGKLSLANSSGGILFFLFNLPFSPNVTVGGTTAAARNIISANGANGIKILGSDNYVQGNFIGTDVTGTARLGNIDFGVLAVSASSSVIGGVTAGARNIISANGGVGVNIASNNLVQGNSIGTGTSGVEEMGNSLGGVSVGSVIGGPFSLGNSIGVRSSVGNSTIGGAIGNIIAFNGRAGVAVSPVFLSGFLISRNSIFSNEGLGIDLESSFVPGPTPNDACDGDSGPNQLQNFPILASAAPNGLNTTIQGTLNSTANSEFTIELFSNTTCDPSGFGEGHTFIGSTTVVTDGNCNASFSVTLPVSVGVGQLITATATDQAGNTSEFSRCVQVQTPFDLCLQDDSNGNILLLNSTTGEYQFTNCSGITISGVGSLIKRGCQVTLQVNGPDRRVLANIDSCSKQGTASFQILSQGMTLTIIDRNRSNNTCACSGTG